MAEKKAAEKKAAPKANKLEAAITKFLHTAARYSESHLVREAADEALIALGAKEAPSDEDATSSAASDSN